MNSNKFFKHTTASFLSVFLLVIYSGCGNQNSNSSSSPQLPSDGNQTLSFGQCKNGATVTYLNPGHAHEVNTPLAGEYIARGNDGEFPLLGGDHEHMFILSANNFSALKAGQTVVVSDMEGHGHSVSLVCTGE